MKIYSTIITDFTKVITFTRQTFKEKVLSLEFITIITALVTRHGSETFLSRLKWNPDTAQSRIMSGVWAVSTWVPNIRFRAVSMSHWSGSDTAQSRFWNLPEPHRKRVSYWFHWSTLEPLLISFIKHYETFLATAKKAQTYVIERVSHLLIDYLFRCALL